MKRIFGMSVLTLLFGLASVSGEAAGTLTARDSSHASIQLRDHQVTVVLNNGFARTEVVQTFHNPNDVDLEALYSFPLPTSASLAELTIYVGEREIHGEVLERARATRIYEEERDAGNDTGLARQNGYQSFEFAVSPVRAQAQTKIRFVYYQPIEIDTAVGRYLYPLQDGGTDRAAASFWIPDERVHGTFSIDVELKSAWPLADVRVPGFESDAQIEELGENHYRVRLEQQDVELNRDVVVYYRLEENLPGRVELLAYRADKNAPGTFMMVVTPGLDLKPITRGADYTFVLDLSGSMEGKLHTLIRGMTQTLQGMTAEDRFRIVTFADHANELTNGWVPATESNVARIIPRLERLRANGSTNLYDGLSLGLSDLDDDRATSILLVTDAATNTGIVDPKEFHQLMGRYDVRVFAFLMGNNGNWPLMRAISEASGGFVAPVSNADDVVGQVLLAKSKIRHESLHDAQLKIKGVKVFDTTDEMIGKVYRGQQLTVFGRYTDSGPASVELIARLTGEDRTYATTFDFPEIDTDHPEIERLWALDRIESINAKRDAGFTPEREARSAVLDLALDHQLVTDYTSMVALSDQAFETHGIERRNQQRVRRERQAQAVRAGRPPQTARVDQSRPMFQHAAPSPRGRGSGAIDPVTGAIALGVGLLAVATRRRRERNEQGRS